MFIQYKTQNDVLLRDKIGEVISYYTRIFKVFQGPDSGP